MKKLLLAFALLFSTAAQAQLTTGEIDGYVQPRLGYRVIDLRVRVWDLKTNSKFYEMLPDSAGRFVVKELPFGAYKVQVTGRADTLGEKTVVIRSVVPTRVQFDSIPVVEVLVPIVKQRALDDGSKSLYTRKTIERLPFPISVRKIETAIQHSPGVAPDANGRFHIRGAGQEPMYVIDGVPISAQMSAMFSTPFNARSVKAVNVRRGGIDAEHEGKSGGIIEVTSLSGYDELFFAHGSQAFGSNSLSETFAELGGNLLGQGALLFSYGSSSAKTYVNAIGASLGERTHGNTSVYYGKLGALLSHDLDLNVSGGYNSVTLSLPGFRSPDSSTRTQKLTNYNGSARLNYQASGSSMFSLLGFWRQNDALTESAGVSDLGATPLDSTRRANVVSRNDRLFFGGKRSTSSFGGQLEFELNADLIASDRLKIGAGLENSPLEETFTFGTTNSGLSDTDAPGGSHLLLPYDLLLGREPFRFDTTGVDNHAFAYLQDEFVTGNWLFNLGVRWDAFDLPTKTSGISPRARIHFYPSDVISMRVSYNRMLSRLPLEYGLLAASSSWQSVGFAATGTKLAIEESHVIDAGINLKLSDLFDIEVSGYGKMIDNMTVMTEFANTGIVLPSTIKEGMTAGGEIEFRTRETGGFSGFVSVSSGATLGTRERSRSNAEATAIGIGDDSRYYLSQYTGSTQFTTPQSELLSGILHLDYSHPSTFLASISARYDDGLPFYLSDARTGGGFSENEARTELLARGFTNEVLDHLDLAYSGGGARVKKVKSRIVLDVSAGINIPEFIGFPMRLTVVVNNLLNSQYIYRFDPWLGGARFGMPRMFALRLDALK